MIHGLLPARWARHRLGGWGTPIELYPECSSDLAFALALGSDLLGSQLTLGDQILKIEVITTEREVFIRFNGITHFRCDRREIFGLQSWVVSRGRVTPTYAIEIYVKCGHNIVLEYDNIEKWTRVLAGLDEIPFLNEWKVQDP